MEFMTLTPGHLSRSHTSGHIPPGHSNPIPNCSPTPYSNSNFNPNSYPNPSSLSYELFVESIMQEDVHVNK